MFPIVTKATLLTVYIILYHAYLFSLQIVHALRSVAVLLFVRTYL